jgi:hypothetical protein
LSLGHSDLEFVSEFVLCISVLLPHLVVGQVASAASYLTILSSATL